MFGALRPLRRRRLNLLGGYDEEPVVELILLTVPACPNAAAFEERLADVLAGYPGAVVHRRVVSDERAAAEAGMHGSPTLLINGVDPFAPPGQVPSLSCRVYRDAAGHAAPAPSAQALRQALAAGARQPEGTNRSK
jgi:hypothetical protein